MEVILTTIQQAGQALVSRRKGLKLSQETLAQPLGISQKRYSGLELNPGRITLDRLLIMANSLGLEVVLRDKTDTSTREW